ncbi:MAG: tetratricopeptide repeat protein [bacterium]
MTTPISDATSSAPQPKAESFVDWFHLNSRLVMYAGIGVIVVALGIWIVQRTSLNATMNSEKQLQIAKQSLNTGNLPLAQSDLKKVVDKYGEKPAGAEAGMLLAQIQFDKGDFQAAVVGLTDLAKKIGNDPNAAPVTSLLGDAQMQLNKAAEAAVQYEKAASLTPLQGQRNFYMSKAGRAYLAAGNAAQARKVFEALANQTSNDGSSVEARVRLGEMVGGGKA